MHDRQMNISISIGTVLKTILLVLLVLFLWKIEWIVLDVLAAIVIASAMEPGVKALNKRRIPRVIAVILVYLALFSVFFGIFFFFVPSLIGDVLGFVESIPMYIQSLGTTGSFEQYATALGLPPLTSISSATLVSGFESALNLSVFSNTFSAAAYVFGGLFSFIIIIVFSFYFAVLETGVDDFLRIIVPRDNQPYVLRLWKRSQHKIGLWMQGQLLLALIMGVLVFLGLTILGVEHALTLAVIAGCFEIIPVFGPTLSAVPAIAIAFSSGGLTLGVLTIALFVIAQQFENHLIYPLVVTRVVGVPPLLVILALIIGGELAGFLGIILSVPVAATIQELVRDIEERRLPKEG